MPATKTAPKIAIMTISPFFSTIGPLFLRIRLPMHRVVVLRRSRCATVSSYCRSSCAASSDSVITRPQGS
jgi:hypothetical protein